MKSIYFLVLAVLSLGCIFPPPNGNVTINTTSNFTNYQSLKSTDQLEIDFSCDIRVQNETKVNNLVVWTCARQSDDEGIYLIDAHPMGAWAVTYLIYDGIQYTEAKTSDELKQFFVPIESENEALTYTYLYEGLNIVQSVDGAPLAGSTNAKKSGSIFTVTILHEDWSMCPCYGSYWKTVYEVTDIGVITTKSHESVYGFQSDCVC